MRKILGSWSGMRKYLEQDMLAESLLGRVRYGCTTYVGMDGCRIFEICIDKEQIKRFSWETVNSYFIDSGYTSNKNPSGISEYWAEFWFLLDKYPMTDRTEYTDEDFCGALETYRNQEIKESIYFLFFAVIHKFDKCLLTSNRFFYLKTTANLQIINSAQTITL